MEWSDIIAGLNYQCSALSPHDFQNLLKNQDPVSEDLQRYLEKNPDWSQKSETLLNGFRTQGLKWITPVSSFYPKSFFGIQNPPLMLTYLGDLSGLQNSVIGVVGSREPSHLGREFIDCELSQLLKIKDLTIVSGAARGIDQAAHACALRNGSPTIAVLPSGLLSPYPRDFSSWYEPILKSGGAVMSEYLPHQFMQKHFFHRRNQIIVGLSPIVLVVEARRRSGTSMTARHALNNHSSVVVVPGSPMDPQYSGSLDLIFDGAHMVRDHLDLLTVINGAH